MKDWIVKMIFKGPKGPCYMESNVRAPDIASAIAAVTAMSPDCYVYFATTKKPTEMPVKL